MRDSTLGRIGAPLAENPQLEDQPDGDAECEDPVTARSFYTLPPSFAWHGVQAAKTSAETPQTQGRE